MLRNIVRCTYDIICGVAMTFTMPLVILAILMFSPNEHSTEWDL
jgi:hypothetical protein